MNPAVGVAGALAHSDLDMRLVEAETWVLSAFYDLDCDWLCAVCRLGNQQNRLGYLLSLAKKLSGREGTPRLPLRYANWSGSGFPWRARCAGSSAHSSNRSSRQRLRPYPLRQRKNGRLSIKPHGRTPSKAASSDRSPMRTPTHRAGQRLSAERRSRGCPGGHPGSGGQRGRGSIEWRRHRNSRQRASCRWSR